MLIFLAVLMATALSKAGGTRNMVTIIPILSLLGGLGLYRVYDFLRARLSTALSVSICGMLLAGIVLNSLAISYQFLRIDGAWKKMGDYLRRDYGNRKIAVSGDGVWNFYEVGDSAIISFYLGKSVCLPDSREEFLKECDLYVYYLPSYCNSAYERHKALYADIKPVAVIANPLQAKRIFIAINGCWPLLPIYSFMFSPPKCFQKDDDKIRLYDVNDIGSAFKRLSTPTNFRTSAA
jgi:hypothetical protein